MKRRLLIYVTIRLRLISVNANLTAHFIEKFNLYIFKYMY